jgi:hypothetical protein
LFTLHADDQGCLEDARRLALSAHQWQDQPHPPLPLFYN